MRIKVESKEDAGRLIAAIAEWTRDPKSDGTDKQKSDLRDILSAAMVNTYALHEKGTRDGEEGSNVALRRVRTVRGV